MAITKIEETAIIDLASLAGGATSTLANCTPVTLDTGMQLIFYVACTFNAAATAGAELSLWPTYDGTNYVTTAWKGWAFSIPYTTLPGAGSAILIATDPISPVPKSMKVKITNLDGVNAITGLKVYHNAQKSGAR
jgi:hypothetical protein